MTELVSTFAVDEVRCEQLPIRYNVAPTQQVYAVAEGRRPEAGGAAPRQLGSFRWGLVPSWAKALSVGAGMINARVEGIETKPAFRQALVRRRCLIPADAFYEWQALPAAQATLSGVGAGAGVGGKRPYAIRPTGGGPMAFAGLWELWRDPAQPDAEVVRSCSIITTEANSVLAPIHHRMPVVLASASWKSWLDRSNRDLDVILGLLVAAPSSDFVVYPVSTRVNRAANDDPDLLTPVEVV